eukprot:3937619-Rhodomonas_salina.1
MSYPHNLGYLGYPQGGYPMPSFPGQSVPMGQPGMPPNMAIAPIAPVQTSTSTPAQPNSPEPAPQAVAQTSNTVERSVEIGARSADQVVPRSLHDHSPAIEHDDHHDDHHEEENIPFFGPFGKGFMEDLKTKLP